MSGRGQSPIRSEPGIERADRRERSRAAGSREPTDVDANLAKSRPTTGREPTDVDANLAKSRRTTGREPTDVDAKSAKARQSAERHDRSHAGAPRPPLR
jgi:hypothetical protein